ncbi:protein FAM214A isoform X1 [Maniola jurtina]|uniref:protein FAM214A isoform X1 n=1 Tax=Maniola jurtina TaxID=191418 RepID=UPI001E68D12D|nr:protein FAM214A isoform X1 [Maniola jurtina]
MHSNEPPPPPPATGTGLLLQLGRLIVRARSSSPSVRRADARPSGSQQVISQPKSVTEEPKPGVEAQLNSHVQALWKEQIPICIEVLLAPDCQECYASLSRVEEEAMYDKLHSQQKALLLERWTMRTITNKNHDSPAAITAHWLLNAVRSQLHFSQLSAWRATIKTNDDKPAERRRKLSRETCNFKKIEANCDDTDLDERKLNIVYSIKIPGESYKMADFPRPPTDHQFPVTDIGDNVYLKVVLQALPRLDDIPIVKCTCKRRASKEMPPSADEELVGKLNDLTLGPRTAKYPADAINSNIGPSNRRLSIISNTGTTEYVYSMDKEKKILDDRMLTPCSESGKHKCSCDDESDDRSHKPDERSHKPIDAKKLDDRRMKEIAKYKRRLRKESKLKKLCDSTSSEGDGLKAKETHTSIPILQAARFDRFRAIGCFRNQTYLTLPASRIESKSPFTETLTLQPTEFRRTNTVATQTDDMACNCGSSIELKCWTCKERGMVRSEGNYNLASIEKGKIENNVKVVLENKGNSSRLPMGSGENAMRIDNGENGTRVENGVNATRRCESGENLVRREMENGESIKNREKDQRPSEGIIENQAGIAMKNIENGPSIENGKVAIENGARRKCEDDSKQLKKLKCDNSVKKCDNISLDNSNSDKCEIIKRPKLRRFPITDRIEKVISDRFAQNNDIEQLNLRDDDTVFSTPKIEVKRQKTYSVGEDYVLFEKCDYGTFDKYEVESPREDVDEKGFKFPDQKKVGLDNQVPSPTEMDRFRWRFDSAASMVFHNKTGLPLTSSPAPLRRGNNCFDFDDSINGVSGIKSALFHPISPPSPVPASPVSPARQTPPPKKSTPHNKLRIGPSTGLLGSFEESALKGRLEPVATVHGFAAELGASGAFCPPHRRLPVTVFFYAPGGTNAPYMGHINLGPHGYRVSRSGTVQVSLFNPHGTLVKMFVVLYDLTSMPPAARTFLRQRTLYMPARAEPPQPHHMHKWLRYLIHLRFMTSKSGKLYLHTDIRILVSRKADLDTATAHSALFRPIPPNQSKDDATATSSTNQETERKPANQKPGISTNRTPNRVFGGCSDFDTEMKNEMREFGYENQNGVSYELRSFTYAPENPKYSPR